MQRQRPVYHFTTLHTYTSEDQTLTTAIVNIQYHHLLFGTQEESTVTVVVTPDGDFMIDRRYKQELSTDPFPELCNHLVNELDTVHGRPHN
jgi:hypothetical protein